MSYRTPYFLSGDAPLTLTLTNHPGVGYFSSDPTPYSLLPTPYFGDIYSFSSDFIMQNTAEYYCAYCGEENTTFIDLSAGGQQSYVEDCQVCCRPNILYIRIDEDTLEIEIDTEFEG